MSVKTVTLPVAVVAVVVAVLVGFGTAGFFGAELPFVGTAEKAAPPRRDAAIEGHVFSQELVPIPNASIVVVDVESSTTSDPEGAYAMPAHPGNYLVIASAPGYRSASASLSVAYQETVRHDFLLEAKPTGTPYHEIFPFKGVIGCEAIVASQFVDCSPVSSANHCCTSVAIPESTANAQFEMYWQAQSASARFMQVRSTFDQDGSPMQLMNERDTSPVVLFLLDSFLHGNLVPNSAWSFEVHLADSLGEKTGDGFLAPPGFAYAQDQAFQTYTTVWHYAQGPRVFSALDEPQG